MRRRDFMTLVGGAAAAWPLAARAQQGNRVRRIAVMNQDEENDPEQKVLLSAFTQALGELGWTDGRNVRIDLRWGRVDINRIGALAKELVDLQPDVILSSTTPVTAAFQRETQTIPIVFVNASDPVGSGFVAGLSHPGGNITGFIHNEDTWAGKLLELLMEIAPGLKRVAAMFNPDTAPYVRSNYLPSFEAAARSFKVEPITAPVHNDTEIETVITSLGREPRGGLVGMSDGFVTNHRATIISLAARNNVPTVYHNPVWPRDGGLLSYGANNQDIMRRAAAYVDRILRGAKPADLPVQLPVTYEMILNLKTAKALGIDVPAAIVARADEVIE
jgi:putative ABC transport system substrate-binding protein